MNSGVRRRFGPTRISIGAIARKKPSCIGITEFSLTGAGSERFRTPRSQMELRCCGARCAEIVPMIWNSGRVGVFPPHEFSREGEAHVNEIYDSRFGGVCLTCHRCVCTEPVYQ